MQKARSPRQAIKKKKGFLTQKTMAAGSCLINQHSAVAVADDDRQNWRQRRRRCFEAFPRDVPPRRYLQRWWRPLDCRIVLQFHIVQLLLLLLLPMIIIVPVNSFSVVYNSKLPTSSTTSTSDVFCCFSSQRSSSTVSKSQLTASPDTTNNNDDDESSLLSSSTDDTIQPLRIRAAVYQPLLHLEGEDHSGITTRSTTTTTTQNDPLTILTEVADVLRIAAQYRIDVVHFPELFLTPKYLLCGNNTDPSDTSKDSSSSSLSAMDRESAILNIVGNLCAELNIACIIGYAETASKDRGGSNIADDNDATYNRNNGDPRLYSSMALFHADGTRAGNYRCVHPSSSSSSSSSSQSSAIGRMFEKGHSWIEAIPISVRLSSSSLSSTGTTTPRTIMMGVMCGEDILIPEHARYLSRAGAQLFAVSINPNNHNRKKNGSQQRRITQQVLPTRSMENQLPVLFSNYILTRGDDGHDDISTGINEEITAAETGVSSSESCCSIGEGGSSVILSHDGTELVRGPESLQGDMPTDNGYFIPCNTKTTTTNDGGGSLYAADLIIPICNSNSNNSSSTINGRIDTNNDDWIITPRNDSLFNNDSNKDTNSRSIHPSEKKKRNSTREGNMKTKSKGFSTKKIE